MGWAYAFHQDKASSVRVPVANVTLFSSTQLLRERVPVGPVFLLGLLVFAIVAAYASRAAAIISFSRGHGMIRNDEDEDMRNRNIRYGMNETTSSERARLGDSEFPQFVPRDVPNLSYESSLISQILEVGQNERVGEAIGTKPDGLFEDSKEVFPGEAGKASLDLPSLGLELHLYMMKIRGVFECGYLARVSSSHSHVNSGPLLEFLSYFDYWNTLCLSLLEFLDPIFPLIRKVESIVDIFEFFRKDSKLCITGLDSFKNFKWSKAFALYWRNFFADLLQLVSVVEFALSFQWFHGLFLVLKILPVEFLVVSSIWMASDILL
ncbi:hypothetical protein Tco_0363989 [Tanacetum coccineum]